VAVVGFEHNTRPVWDSSGSYCITVLMSRPGRCEDDGNNSNGSDYGTA
jgi:hypothetical protein